MVYYFCSSCRCGSDIINKVYIISVVIFYRMYELVGIREIAVAYVRGSRTCINVYLIRIKLW